ncbi:3-oxoacyl-[acyl-carrier-protein] synthase-3 [Paenibacillaceae bacterium GAS479]|nr:3-oxoacyl-[acyl-carrier-protein] synthase-3 [Paenibacillaceae bacterium GAS479]
MTAVRIRGIEMYHPSNEVDNEYYINRFAEAGVPVSGLMKALGREKRYIIDNQDENTFTMSVAASRKLLQSAGVSAEELDLIIFTSQTPEYLIPSVSMKIHAALGAGKGTMCYDINANCAGILVAMEQASRTMMANPRVRKVLVVGAEHLSVHSTDNPVYHSNFADSAAAILLQAEEGEGGFIDSVSQTNTMVIDNSLFPGTGLSNMYRDGVVPTDVHVQFTPFDDSVCVDSAVDCVREVMERNGVKAEEVGHFLFSQFSIGNNKLVVDRLGLDENKVHYVGDKYGYTASNSPILALHDAVKAGKVERGEYLVFWTVGAGWQNIALLMKY